MKQHVLTRFPFTDLSADKRRPALVVSQDNERRLERVVCFIASVSRTGPDMAPLAALKGTGKPGDAPAAWLVTHRKTFLDVFGLNAP